VRTLLKVFLFLVVAGFILKFFWVFLAIGAVVALVKFRQARMARGIKAREEFEAGIVAQQHRVHALEISTGVVLPTPEESVKLADYAARKEYDARMARLTALRDEGVLSPGEFLVRRTRATDAYLAVVDKPVS